MTRSQAGLAIGGVLLVIGTVAGGLGLCALIPLTQNFNAITTQVLPFIALAIGVNSMFSFVHVYYELATTSPLIVYEVSQDYHCKNSVLYYEREWIDTLEYGCVKRIKRYVEECELLPMDYVNKKQCIPYWEHWAKNRR